MDYTFKNHKLGDAERLWLIEAAKANPLDYRVLKVKLLGKIPVDFDHKKIETRIWNNQRPTLIGRWLLNQADPIFVDLNVVIKTIRAKIIEQPGVSRVTAEEIASSSGLPQSTVEDVLYVLGQLNGFVAGAHGSTESPNKYTVIMLEGDSAYDAYLKYEDVFRLMEQLYVDWAPRPVSAPNLFLVDGFGSTVGGPIEPFTQSVVQKFIKPNTAFVLMAIDPNNYDIEDIYCAIKETCLSFGITAYRADEIQHQESITNVILSELSACEYLIADLTHEKPNVYYEIGYAHALKKNPILLKRATTRVHFDLYVHNVISYRNATEVRKSLKLRLEAILGRSSKES